jgi:hypothetical protein
MKKTNRFQLQKHRGPYELWPLRSRLLDEGEKTKTKLPGYDLLIALELEDGRFLMIMDYDCPFEELATAVLLDSNLKILGKKRFPGGPMINPAEFVVESESSVIIETYGVEEKFRVQIRDKKWFFQSPIKIERIEVESKDQSS